MPIPDAMLKELADSRFGGEDDLHFYARWSCQKSMKWREAKDTLESCKARMLSTETIKHLEDCERRTRFELESTVELLSEALAREAFANPSLPIQRNGVANGR